MSGKPIEWTWCEFDVLTAGRLYEFLRLRQAVFGIEQHCLYQDLDGVDAGSWHLGGWSRPGGQAQVLAAYLRVIAPGIKYREPSIGRVVTAQAFRRAGLGRALMHEGIRRTEIAFPDQAIRISAQQYLTEFYRSFGFEVCSPPYAEDGIMHVEMLRDIRRA